MAFLKEITKVTAIYMQLSIIMMISITQHSKARELRPSDHGLDHQSLPPIGAKFPPDMKEFFGASNSATRNSMSPSTGVAFPKAKNSSDASWWRTVGGGGGKGGGDDHVRHLLLLASLVCGVTGLGLLVSSAVICYCFIRHKNKHSSSAATDNNRSITVYAGK
ncbi:PREDICTED: uncharacterized protein LOC105139973 [Populus euphratica]|uniref:Uncharacterized protein LOC105139973 n=1 Tax=Populus euphratica TaxID=75702 RepID=A0AAJ6VCI1_POPEU|nr:PREDICTED: uncharacterized protein LOC105139973 [Populus euphratica]